MKWFEIFNNGQQPEIFTNDNSSVSAVKIEQA